MMRGGTGARALSDPAEWSAVKLSSWLQSQGCSAAVVAGFRRHGVTGGEAVQMPPADLFETLRIPELADRRAAWAALCELRSAAGAAPWREEETGGSKPDSSSFVDADGDFIVITVCGGQVMYTVNFTPRPPVTGIEYSPAHLVAVAVRPCIVMSLVSGATAVAPLPPAHRLVLAGIARVLDGVVAHDLWDAVCRGPVAAADAEVLSVGDAVLYESGGLERGSDGAWVTRAGIESGAAAVADGCGEREVPLRCVKPVSAVAGMRLRRREQQQPQRSASPSDSGWRWRWAPADREAAGRIPEIVDSRFGGYERAVASIVADAVLALPAEATSQAIRERPGLLAEALKMNSSLQGVDFGGMLLADKVVAEVVAGLAGHPSLERVSVAGNGAGLLTVAALERVFATAPRLRAVDLSDNLLDERAAPALLRLASSGRLTTLRVTGNPAIPKDVADAVSPKAVLCLPRAEEEEAGLAWAVAAAVVVALPAAVRSEALAAAADAVDAAVRRAVILGTRRRPEPAPPRRSHAPPWFDVPPPSVLSAISEPPRTLPPARPIDVHALVGRALRRESVR